MGRQRALYLSSSIGLGHVSRDLAIAAELRRLAPELEFLWLAAPPASDTLRAAGETVLAEASQWRGASRIAERCMSHGRLDLVHYVYRSLPAWAMNARLFRRVVDRTQSISPSATRLSKSTCPWWHTCCASRSPS